MPWRAASSKKRSEEKKDDRTKLHKSSKVRDEQNLINKCRRTEFQLQEV